MTVEEQMNLEIDNLKSKIDSKVKDSNKLLNDISNDKKELSIKLKAKAMFLGIKIPKKTKKKESKNKLQEGEN